MAYKYDKLKEEYKHMMKNDPTDRETNLKFLRKYNIGNRKNDELKLPDRKTVYQWYSDIFGKNISTWTIESETSTPTKTDASTELELIADLDSGERKVIDVAHVKIEGVETPLNDTKSNVIPPPMNAESTQTEPVSSFVTKSGRKIKVELGKIGIIIADIEGWTYRKWHMRSLTEEERVETTNAMKDVIDNRVKIISEYGDILNVAIVIGSHTASRVAEAHINAAEQKQQQQQKPSSGNDNTGYDPYAPMIAGKDYPV